MNEPTSAPGRRRRVLLCWTLLLAGYAALVAAQWFPMLEALAPSNRDLLAFLDAPAATAVGRPLAHQGRCSQHQQRGDSR